MQDPRKPRTLKVRALSVLVIDANKYGLKLLCDILRTLDVGQISPAGDLEMIKSRLIDRPIDVILLSWEPGDAIDGPGFIHTLRRANDARIRQIPLILVMSNLTREKVLAGRDAGADEFVTKPISPGAVQQRLQMVVETPRPFVDHPVYIGPCRRRKNPADYHGEKRRRGERGASGAVMIDADEEAAKEPIRVVLAGLREACSQWMAGDPNGMEAAMLLLRSAKDIAVSQSDSSLLGGLSAFEAYIGATATNGLLEGKVVEVALTALEQLAALPIAFKEARNSVAVALGKAIRRKLVA